MIKDDHHYELTVILKKHLKNYVMLVKVQIFTSTKSATKLKHETFE